MIPLLKPYLPPPEKWLPYFQESYNQIMFSNGGPNQKLLEKKIQEYLGLAYTPVLICNATTALTIALKALKIKGEVLIPSFTFMATAHSVLNAGCTPVLVDISENLEFSVEDAENKITDKTTALIVVHALGFSVDYKKYQIFADKQGFKLIFDAAPTFGAKYLDGKLVGSGVGDCEVFSLHITKTFGIGEGGLITSKDKDFLYRCRRNINFGIERTQGTFGEVVDAGMNAKMSEIHAAIGLSVLEILPYKLWRKGARAAEYEDLLKKLPVKCWYKRGAYQVFPVLFENNDIRTKVIKNLIKNEIGYREYYTPIHYHSFFKKKVVWDKDSLSVTNDIAERILCIPIFDEMTPEEVIKVVEVIKECL